MVHDIYIYIYIYYITLRVGGSKGSGMQYNYLLCPVQYLRRYCTGNECNTVSSVALVNTVSSNPLNHPLLLRLMKQVHVLLIQ